VPTLAAVIVPVRPDLSGFPGATRVQLNNAFRQVTPVVESNAKKHGSRFGSVFGSGVGETINSKLSPALAGVGDEFGAFAGAAMGPLGAITAGVGLLAGQAVNMGVRTAASMEQAQIGFETLLGSEKAAGDYLADLQQFAARTPFELPGLIESSRTLLGVGLSADQTKAALLAFGNASSAVGVGQENFQRVMIALSQSIGTGRFQTEELNQVTENGIPIWTILSRAMGKPVPAIRALAQQGKLMTADVLPLLEKQMNKDYGGAMERQSRSLSGVWSTFMDTLNIGMANVLQPLIPLMTTGLTTATNVLGSALGAIPRLFSNTTEAGQQFSKIIRQVAGWVTGDLVPAFQSVAARILPQVQGAMRAVGQAFADHQDVIAAVGDVLKGLGWVIVHVVLPALGFIASVLISQVAPAIRILLSVVGAVSAVVRAVVTGVPAIGTTINNAFYAAWDAVSNFTTNAARAVAGWATSAYQAVAGWATGVYRALSGFGQSVNNAITGAFRAAGTLLVNVGATVVQGLINGWNTVAPHLAIAAGHTRDGIMIVFRGAGSLLTGAGRAILQGLINGYNALIAPWLNVVTGFIQRYVIAPMARSITFWVGFGRNLITGLINGARSLWGAVTAFVSTTINRYIIGPWSRAIAWLVGPGRNIITGLINGARAMWGNVVSFISTTINRYIISPFSRSLSFLVQFGRNIIQGLINGMSVVARTIASWIQTHVINPITSTAARAWNSLFNIGYNLLNAIKSGISSAVRGISGWINANVVQPIIKAVKWFFGIKSPSTVMAGIGVNLIKGLVKGLVTSNPTQLIGKVFGGMPNALAGIVNKGLVSITQLPSKAWNALSSVGGWAMDKLKSVGGFLSGLFGSGGLGGGGGGAVSGGVSRWSSVVLQALSMLGQSSSWLPTVLSRMQRESGGNPRAINLWDINAQRGDPSRGLMQTIGSTFAAYAGPLRGRGIYDPLANVYAGLNYALHRYGSLAALSRPGGYDAGGWLPPGGVGINLTGRPERVLDPQQSEAYARSGGLGGGVRVLVMLDGQVIDDRVHVIVEDAIGELGARIDNGIGG
jgi:tape measure domain-containing protein